MRPYRYCFQALLFLESRGCLHLFKGNLLRFLRIAISDYWVTSKNVKYSFFDPFSILASSLTKIHSRLTFRQKWKIGNTGAFPACEQSGACGWSNPCIVRLQPTPGFQQSLHQMMLALLFWKRLHTQDLLRLRLVLQMNYRYCRFRKDSESPTAGLIGIRLRSNIVWDTAVWSSVTDHRKQWFQDIVQSRMGP